MKIRLKLGVGVSGDLVWCGVVWWCSNSGVLLLHADLCHAQPQSPSVAVTPPCRHHPVSPLSDFASNGEPDGYFSEQTESNPTLLLVTLTLTTKK